MVLVVPLEFSPWPGEEQRLESCKDAQTPHIPPFFFGNYREIQAREKPDGLGKGLKFGRVALLVAEFIKKKEVWKTRINPRPGWRVGI